MSLEKYEEEPTCSRGEVLAYRGDKESLKGVKEGMWHEHCIGEEVENRT